MALSGETLASEAIENTAPRPAKAPHTFAYSNTSVCGVQRQHAQNFGFPRDAAHFCAGANEFFVSFRAAEAAKKR